MVILTPSVADVYVPAREDVVLDLEVEEVAGELLLQVAGVWDVELDAELQRQHMGTCT